MIVAWSIGLGGWMLIVLMEIKRGEETGKGFWIGEKMERDNDSGEDRVKGCIMMIVKGRE